MLERSFRLGRYEVDPTTYRVRGPDGERTLEPKVMAVLTVLAERSGAVVTRRDLMEQVWPREYGGDESLTRAVSILRKTLGGRGSIDTIPKRGYRLRMAPEAVPEPRIDRAPSHAGGARGAALAILALLLASGGWWALGERGPPALVGTSAPVVLAVLPFEQQGGDDRDKHLAEGLADEVLSVLSKSPAIAVVAGTSSFQFRDDRKNLERLRRELAITHLIDGTVRRSSLGLRVSVHLIDAASGHLLWSDVLERGEASFFTIPDDIALPVLAALDADPKRTRPRRARRPDSAAYQGYLQARALLRDGTPESLRRAVALLDTAVASDPRLAEAWALRSVALLNVLLTDPDTQDFVDPVERSRAARRAAEQALALDPGQLDAQVALAILDYRERRITLAEAEDRFRALVERAPHHPNVNLRMGMMLGEVGRVEEGYRYLRRAFELDPFSGLTIGMYSGSLYMTGRWSEGHALIERTNHIWAVAFLPYCQYTTFLLEGRFDDARSWVAAARASPPSEGSLFGPATDPLLDGLALAADELEATGRVQDATFARIRTAVGDGAIFPFNAAEVYGAPGRHDEAFELIRERHAVGDRWFRVLPFRPSVVRQAVCKLLSVSRPRFTFSRMSVAVLVQM